MAAHSRSKKKTTTAPGWLASLLGAIFLIVSGFLLGLVVGVVKEEPELVIGHIAGRSQQIDWTEEEPVLAAEADPLLEDYTGEVPVDLPGWTEAEVGSEPVAAPQVEVASRPAPVAASAEIKPRAARTVDVDSLPEVSAGPGVSGDGFSVQVGAFSDEPAADRVAADLRQKGFPVYVLPARKSKDARWKVRVGPLPNKQEAQKVAQQLKVEERLPTWVLSEGGG